MRLVIFILALLLVGCRDKPEPPPEEPPEEVVEVEEPAKKEDGPPPLPREVFGVPLPPQTIGVDIIGSRARVTVDMRIGDVKSFYQTRLIDYELVETPSRLSFIGLREYMPTIKISMFKSQGPTFLEILPNARPAPVVEVVKKDPPKYGEEVDTKLPNGQLLAPGARWGQPYTPPPGSPLDKPRFRVNYGKPFGEWTPQ